MAVPWRHAATLMLAIRGSREVKNMGHMGVKTAKLRTVDGTMISDQNYKMLMLKRTKFMAWPNCYVYPGGVVDKSDFSSKWWDVFNRRGPSSLTEVNAVVGQVAEPLPYSLRPSSYIYTDESAKDVHKLPPEMALRITAIRETFEECGVLLARPNIASIKEPVAMQKVADTKKWQERVRNNAADLMQLYVELDCCPDVWALHEWSVWLSPVHIKPRFETMFFICTLDEKPDLIYSPNEVSNHLWCSPFTYLASFAEKEIWLPPPQVYELSRLLNITELDDLEEFAEKRRRNELITIFPVRAQARDGLLHILPGDDLYPKDPDFVQSAPAMNYNHSLQELEDDTRYLNRQTFRDDNSWRMICNVELRDGHKKPFSLEGQILSSNL